MSTKTTGMIRIGVGGWTFEPWRGSFFPKGLPHKQELHFASRKLTSIEVNGTYYRTQTPETFAQWHDATPEDFVFSLKAPRYATNRRVLSEAGESIERFLTSGMTELKDKLGPINWQFMPTKQFDPVDFEAFLELLPASYEGRTLRHVVEVRHDSFCTEEFVAMVRAYGVAPVLSADGDYPQIADPTASFVYARILGTVEDEPLGYNEAALDEWAARLRELAQGSVPSALRCFGPTAPKTPRDVYLYVISGHKPLNPQAAMALIEKLR